HARACDGAIATKTSAVFLPMSRAALIALHSHRVRPTSAPTAVRPMVPITTNLVMPHPVEAAVAAAHEPTTTAPAAAVAPATTFDRAPIRRLMSPRGVIA